MRCLPHPARRPLERSGSRKNPVAAPLKLVRHVDDRAGHDRRYSIDTSKSREELGWTPVVPLEEGFRRTVAWYTDNRAWWEPIKQSGGYIFFTSKVGQGTTFIATFPAAQMGDAVVAADAA